MKKKVLSGGLALALCLTMLPQVLAQPEEAAAVTHKAVKLPEIRVPAESSANGTDSADTVTVNGKTYLLNYHDVDFDVEAPKRSGIPALKGTLPAAYSSVVDAGKSIVTTAKDQDPYGCCWAFSATAAAESSYCVNGGTLADFSPLQLAYFFYHDKVDPLGNATGDKTMYLTENCLDEGGNNFFTMWAAAGWTNAILEETLPYTSSNQTKALEGTISDDYANAYDVAHLQNAYIIAWDGTTASKNNIKQAIMDYGMVACSYYHDDWNMNESNGVYAYYSDEEGTNHAVSIVGWNDNFSKNNFLSSNVRNNGAWLVRNSWGSDFGTDGDSNPDNKGSQGYFWLSYEDVSLLWSGQVFVYDFAPASKYQYNYQYDGSCGEASIPLDEGDMMATIYEVKGLTADVEQIDAVGIGIASASVSGTVYVTLNPDEDDPASGEPAAVVPFDTNALGGGYPGFYTIEIPGGVPVKKGDTYSVVVTFDQDCDVFIDYSYQNGNWIEFVNDTQKDKSYWLYWAYLNETPDNYQIVVPTMEDGYTFRIKAFTNDVVDDTPTLSDVQASRTSLSAATLTVTPSTAGTLYYAVSDVPIDNYDPFISEDSQAMTAETARTVELTLPQTVKDTDTATVYYYYKSSTGAQSEIASAEIPALGHVYAAPTWLWEVNDSGVRATAKFTCINGDGHTEEVAAEVTAELTKAATPSTNGELTCTALVEFGGEEFSDTKVYDYVCAVGDLNGNGTFDADDVKLLSHYVAKIKTIPDEATEIIADVNADGTVNALDIAALARELTKKK